MKTGTREDMIAFLRAAISKREAELAVLRAALVQEESMRDA